MNIAVSDKISGAILNAKISRLITYAYIAPVIIVCGILGDVLTVVTLTHPLLRKSTIVYTYLTLLAMTDLVSVYICLVQGINGYPL
ncbi:hypothetical protein ANCDUO_00093 [Ancylostoma duodenale]|uniref:G-protein coupled receptors family 1 profile domain-containing protein n=1 Tax=Ancylostoma duodenale TaxID=51022 RepID=A0A0C2HCX7_9BILA|nr:hypothetical protein ANCDUO_00093 [Ancylostoma duodenale]